MTKIGIEFLLAHDKVEVETVISLEDVNEVYTELLPFKKYLDFPYIRCLSSLERSCGNEVLQVIHSKDYNNQEYKKTVAYELRRLLYLMEFSQENIDKIMELIINE